MYSTTSKKQNSTENSKKKVDTSDGRSFQGKSPSPASSQVLPSLGHKDYLRPFSVASENSTLRPGRKEAGGKVSITPLSLEKLERLLDAAGSFTSPTQSPVKGMNISGTNERPNGSGSPSFRPPTHLSGGKVCRGPNSMGPSPTSSSPADLYRHSRPGSSLSHAALPTEGAGGFKSGASFTGALSSPNLPAPPLRSILPLSTEILENHVVLEPTMGQENMGRHKEWYVFDPSNVSIDGVPSSLTTLVVVSPSGRPPAIFTRGGMPPGPLPGERVYNQRSMSFGGRPGSSATGGRWQSGSSGPRLSIGGALGSGDTPLAVPNVSSSQYSSGSAGPLPTPGGLGVPGSSANAPGSDATAAGNERGVVVPPLDVAAARVAGGGLESTRLSWSNAVIFRNEEAAGGPVGQLAFEPQSPSAFHLARSGGGGGFSLGVASTPMASAVSPGGVGAGQLPTASSVSLTATVADIRKMENMPRAFSGNDAEGNGALRAALPRINNKGWITGGNNQVGLGPKVSQQWQLVKPEDKKSKSGEPPLDMLHSAAHGPNGAPPPSKTLKLPGGASLGSSPILLGGGETGHFLLDDDSSVTDFHIRKLAETMSGLYAERHPEVAMAEIRNVKRLAGGQLAREAMKQIEKSNKRLSEMREPVAQREEREFAEVLRVRRLQRQKEADEDTERRRIEQERAQQKPMGGAFRRRMNVLGVAKSIRYHEPEVDGCEGAAASGHANGVAMKFVQHLIETESLATSASRRAEKLAVVTRTHLAPDAPYALIGWLPQGTKELCDVELPLNSPQVVSIPELLAIVAEVLAREERGDDLVLARHDLQTKHESSHQYLSVARQNPVAFDENSANQAEADYRSNSERAKLRLGQLHGTFNAETAQKTNSSASFSSASFMLTSGGANGEPIGLITTGAKPMERFKNSLSMLLAQRPFFVGPQVSVRPLPKRSPILPFKKNEVIEEKPWDLETSIFKERKKENDAKDFWDNESVIRNQFNSDWIRIVNKSRFRKVVGREDAGVKGKGQGIDVELEEIREELYKEFHFIRTAFIFFSLKGSTDSNSILKMTPNDWSSFCSSAGITDEKWQGSRAADMSNIFVAVNFEEESNMTAESQANDDAAMMRFEFLEGIVRAAFGKFINSGRTDDASDAVGMLLVHMRQMLPVETMVDLNFFRRRRLYTKEMEQMVIHYLDLLQACFKLYKACDRTKFFAIEHWSALLEANGLYAACFGLTRFDTRLIFCWAQVSVADELKRRKRAVALCFWDFVECLSRLADLISPPEEEEMKQWLEEQYGGEEDFSVADVPNVPYAYYNSLVEAGAGENGSSSVASLERRSSAGIQDNATRPLHVKFRLLMSYLEGSCFAQWGGSDLKELAMKMTRAANMVSGGIELG